LPTRSLSKSVNLRQVDYFVVGDDGKEYGPATFEQLQAWAAENRVLPETKIKSFQTGVIQPASAIPGLFAAVAPPPATPVSGNWQNPPNANTYYQRPTTAAPSNEGNGDIIGAIVRSALAIVFFFVLHGFGVFFAGYGLYYAIQAKSKGHRHANIAIAICGVTFAVVLTCFILRTASTPSRQ